MHLNSHYLALVIISMSIGLRLNRLDNVFLNGNQLSVKWNDMIWKRFRDKSIQIRVNYV